MQPVSQGTPITFKLLTARWCGSLMQDSHVPTKPKQDSTSPQ